MRSISIMKRENYPVIFDATHSVQQPGGKGHQSGGQREFIYDLSKAAVSIGISGLFIEVHDDPDNAPSDGPNMLKLSEFETLGLDRPEPRSRMHLRSYQHHPVKFLSRVKLHVAERLSNRDWLKIPNRALPDLALRKIQEQIDRLDEPQLQPSVLPLGADSAGGCE